MENTHLHYEKYHTHIEANNKKLGLNIKEVWNYKDLIWLFTKKNFKLIYKQTVLGPLWIILTPIISSLMYLLIFGKIAKLGSDGVPQILFYLSGTAIWNMFSSTLTQNANTFVQNANVFSKVYFPRLTMPVSTVISSVIQFLVQSILVVILLVYFVIRGEVHPNYAYWFMIPIILIQLGMLGLGFGIIISSLTTKYRDLTLLVAFGVQLWMYGTPVVYPLSQISNKVLKTIIMINPVSMPIEMFRYSLFGVGELHYFYYGLSWVIAIVVLIIGILIFNKVEKTFVDTV